VVLKNQLPKKTQYVFLQFEHIEYTIENTFWQIDFCIVNEIINYIFIDYSCRGGPISGSNVQESPFKQESPYRSGRRQFQAPRR